MKMDYYQVKKKGITLFREAYTIALTIPILTNYCHVIHSEFFYLNPKKMRL